LQQIRLMMDRPLRINPMFGNPPDVGEKKTGNAPCGSQQDRDFKTDQIEGPNLLIAQYFSTIADHLSICQPSRGRIDRLYAPPNTQHAGSTGRITGGATLLVKLPIHGVRARPSVT